MLTMNEINFSIKTNKNNDKATFTCNKYTLELIRRALEERGTHCESLGCNRQAAKYNSLAEKVGAIVDTMKAGE